MKLLVRVHQGYELSMFPLREGDEGWRESSLSLFGDDMYSTFKSERIVVLVNGFAQFSSAIRFAFFAMATEITC